MFAQQAFVLPAPADRPKDQVVQLVGPLIVTYEHQTDKTANPLIADRRHPKIFSMASSHYGLHPAGSGNGRSADDGGSHRWHQIPPAFPGTAQWP